MRRRPSRARPLARASAPPTSASRTSRNGWPTPYAIFAARILGLERLPVALMRTPDAAPARPNRARSLEPVRPPLSRIGSPTIPRSSSRPRRRPPWSISRLAPRRRSLGRRGWNASRPGLPRPSRRAGRAVAKSYAEPDGVRWCAGGARWALFTLKARADRIGCRRRLPHHHRLQDERQPRGARAQCQGGTGPQLALEAAIAAAGALGTSAGRWRPCAMRRPPAASPPGLEAELERDAAEVAQLAGEGAGPGLPA